MINKRGVCCIVLALEENDPPFKFRTMTYKRFSSLPRAEALVKLGEVIQNNLLVTEKAIEYCGQRDLNYRLSSNIFPLMTYDKAELTYEDLPQLESIVKSFEAIRQTRKKYDVRLSSHPDQFNVLASDNLDAVKRTIRELDFQSGFMSRICCPVNHWAPINIHVNRSAKTEDERKRVSDIFYENYSKLEQPTRARLVLENDDKTAGWTVDNLFDHFRNPEIPITFDYLHHKCHPGEGYTSSEHYAIGQAVSSWLVQPGHPMPLFHYSESIPGDKNPRKHADMATATPDTYEYTFDLDYEFKMKEKSIPCK